MPQPPDLSFALGLPPERAIAYFKAKGYAITFDWREMMAEANAKAFTVAKAMKLDVLQAIREETQRALDQGLTLSQFRKSLEPRLKSLGWWGKQEMVDPLTGEVKKVQLGSPHRLKTIYQTNLQTAYMAGRYREQKANAADQPFWQYVAVMDARTRPAHRVLNGRVFHHGDPLWGSMYPPNGWNCRCRVRAMDGERVASKGLTVEDSNGRMELVEVPVGRDLRPTTAAVYTTPEGAKVRTDPGWAYNPGKSWPLFDKAGHLPDCTGASFAEKDGKPGCIRIVAGQPDWKSQGRPDLRTVPASLRQDAPQLLPRAASQAEARDMMARALGLDRSPMVEVKTPVGKMFMRHELLTHMVEKTEHGRERYANFILPTFENPFEVYLTEYEDGFRERYLGLFKGKNDLMVVARVNQDGSLFWNMMQADDKSMNKQRVGKLLHGK